MTKTEKILVDLDALETEWIRQRHVGPFRFAVKKRMVPPSPMLRLIDSVRDLAKEVSRLVGDLEEGAQ